MTTQNNSSKTRKPVQSFTDKLLRVSIWENSYTDKNTGEVKPIHNLTFQRSYEIDGKWYKTSSINSDDALRVIELYKEATRWVRDKKHAELMHKYHSGTQVTPVIPPEQDVPQEVIAAAQVVQQSQPAQESGQ